MELVVVVVLGAVAFIGGLALIIAVVLGLLSRSRLSDKADGLRPSQRRGSS